MADSNAAGSPLEAAGGLAGPHATEAFELLANETRLAILLSLWEAYEPHAQDNGVSFSALRDRVGVQDSGQFNYHLGKLEGRFIQKGDTGYELRRAGLLLVQSIIAGTGIEEPEVDSEVIGAECEFCGAPTAITYENVYVYQVCTECPGGEFGPDHPAGAIIGWTFEPTGLSNRTAEEIFTISTIKNLSRGALRFEEICPECSGTVDWTLDVCDNHEPSEDADCPNCGREALAVVTETCTVCKSSGRGNPAIKVLMHPAVISFFYDHGIEIGYTGDTDFADVVQTLDLVEGFEEELVSLEPMRINVTIRVEGDELRLVLDDEMNVVEVTENH